MEAVGLGIGIPGIFAACLDLVERVELYRSFGAHSQQLIARFEASKLKLQEWAQAVGIANGTLLENHHIRLDIPEVAAVVKPILYSLCDIFDTTEQIQSRSRFTQKGNKSHHSVWPILHSNEQVKDKEKSSSTRGGIRWAIKGRNQFSEQVEMMEILIGKLYDIVPPNSEKIQSLQILGVSGTDSDALALFQHDLHLLMEKTKRNIVKKAQKDIDEWLGILKIESNYDKYIADRLEGTCKWIFHHAAYREWASVDFNMNTAKFLWINGPAGYGKTILCARLVQHLATSTTSPTVYFFSSTHVKAGGQPDGIVRSWLSQLTRVNKTAFDLVHDSAQSGQTEQVAFSTKIWSIFETVVSTLNDGIFILDGFDEYSLSDGSRKNFLQELKKVSAGTKTRYLITSRAEADIELELNVNACHPRGLSHFVCRMSEYEVKADIALYSNKVVEKRLPRKDGLLRHQLAAEMAAKCGGMFLWIKLQQEQLRDGKSRKALWSIVKSMPTGLHQSYERNWMSIQNLSQIDRERAISILRWTIFARRPLTVAELTEALIIDPESENTNFPVDDMPDEIDDGYIESEIKSLCGSLIEIRAEAPNSSPGSRTVHVVHVSVQQYLVSVLPVPWKLDSSPTTPSRNDIENGFLAKLCLRYLNYEDVWKLEDGQKYGVAARMFVRYAANSWSAHMPACEIVTAKFSDLLNTFFTPENKNFNAWTNYFEHLNSGAERCTGEQPWGGLYYAALFGLNSTMKYVHDFKDIDIDLVRQQYGTALQAACYAGQQTAFACLIKWGANINIKGGKFGTALNTAAAQGHEAMVNELLQYGADLNIQDGTQRTALHFACQYNHIGVVSSLLEADAPMQVRDADGLTPVSIASSQGYTGVVRMLTVRGADVSIANNNGWTPLNLAADSGHLEVVEELINHGADTAKANKDEWTPLHSAAQNGYLEVVKLLVEHQADLNAKENDGWTPLHQAVQNGHLAVIKLLVEHQADVDAKENDGWTPLHLAVWNGHLEVVKLLVEHQADVNMKNVDGCTLLHPIIWSGHLDMAKLLVEHQADVNAKEIEGRTPLHLAVWNGHLEVVKLLVEHQADVNARKANGWTPLHSAAQNGHLEVTKLLLEHQADVNAKKANGWTPLHLAAQNGHLEVIKLLVEYQANVNTRSNNGWTPLHSAAEDGYLEVVEFLVKSIGAVSNISVSDSLWRTPMHVAVYYSQVEVAKCLIEHGADLSIIDGYGKTALDWASMDEAIFHQLGKFSSTYVPTPDAIQIEMIQRSICQLSENLLETKWREMSPGFHELGRCLLFLQQLNDACFSFQQQMRKFNEEGSAIHQVACNACDEESFSGSRFVCKTCPDFDVCSSCIRKYQGSNMGASHIHEFLEISGSSVIIDGLEGSDTISDEVQEWLRQLMVRYE